MPDASPDVRATLARLFVHPVKSCAGVELREARLMDTGLDLDRAWMVVDEGGRFVTQRVLPRMALMLAAMVMVASVFTMRHMRGRKTGGLVLGAFAAGLALFFLRNMAQVLGDNAGVPPSLAGWAPPIVGILFAIGILLQLEDG